MRIFIGLFLTCLTTSTWAGLIVEWDFEPPNGDQATFARADIAPGQVVVNPGNFVRTPFIGSPISPPGSATDIRDPDTNSEAEARANGDFWSVSFNAAGGTAVSSMELDIIRGGNTGTRVVFVDISLNGDGFETVFNEEPMSSPEALALGQTDERTYSMDLSSLVGAGSVTTFDARIYYYRVGAGSGAMHYTSLRINEVPAPTPSVLIALGVVLVTTTRRRARR